MRNEAVLSLEDSFNNVTSSSSTPQWVLHDVLLGEFVELAKEQHGSLFTFDFRSILLFVTPQTDAASRGSAVRRQAALV